MILCVSVSRFLQTFQTNGCPLSPQQAFSDHLFQRYTELCTEPDRVSDIEAAQQKELLSYMIPYTHPGAHRITLYIEEKPKLLSGSGTTGFRTWPAALHLGTYLADPANHNLVIGKRILDLGAGTGLVSLLCTWLGAETVLATDREEEIIEAIYNNIHHNQPLMGNRTPRMDTEILDWNSHASLVRCLELQHLSVREAPPNNNQDNINVSGPEALQHLQHQDSIKNAPAVDLILGADIIYDPSVFHGLVATIITLLTARADPPPRCIIAVTVRNLATIAAFRDICERMNLHVRDIEYECKPHERQEGMYHRHGPDQRIWILEVERNGLMTMR